MILVSQSAIEAVVRDIKHMQETGEVPEYVQRFWADRSDSCEQDAQASEQPDNQSKKELAQA
jgi:hypothetical protein